MLKTARRTRTRPVFEAAAPNSAARRALSPVAVERQPAPRGLRFYAAPILLSAFLLFLVQPILAKAVLPWFGGVASTWIVVMLFFQVMLLAGYVYAYLSVRFLPPRLQPICHISLLAASLFSLPVNPWRFWHGSESGDPAIQILRILALSAGAPYLLLSTTGPLLQAWYARSNKIAFPYRLFALSNLGSLAALLAYPVVVEPFVTTRRQTLAWSALYGIFAVLCGTAAVRFLKNAATWIAKPSAGEKAVPGSPPGPREYLLWTLLAACGSALLVTVMNHICQDVTPIPLLWILPLATYLLTFILCFDRQGWYRPGLMRWLLPPALAILMYGVYYNLHDAGANAVLLIVLNLACLFVGCLFAHGELARRKPHASHLTGYYLALALGGAAATLLIGLLAPRISSWQVELPMTLVICGLLALAVLYPPNRITRRAAVVLLAILALLAAGFGHASWYAGARPVYRARSFYGAYAVDDMYPFEVRSLPLRGLYNGSILHGSQIRAAEFENVPTSYYGPKSGIGRLLTTRTREWNVAAIGLGTGTLAAYGRMGDSFTFYEIDPLVAEISSTNFSYLSQSRASVKTIIGDGRLSIQRAAPAQFDLLVVDAFSGDSIPIHLLTREAFETYFSKLKADGVIAIHISNRFVDLMPVVSAISAALGKQAVSLFSPLNGSTGAVAANWVLIAAGPNGFRELPSGELSPIPPPPAGFEIWTDDYSNLIQLLM